jgi:hypothetical protein
MEHQVIVGFIYCENDESYIGLYHSVEAFINDMKLRHMHQDSTEILDVQVKSEGKNLPWGYAGIFRTKYFGVSYNYGYVISTIK